MKLMTRKLQRAQGMTEYIIIVAVIAILSIAVITKYGDHVRAMFQDSAVTMSGTGEKATIDNFSAGDSKGDISNLK